MRQVLAMAMARCLSPRCTRRPRGIRPTLSGPAASTQQLPPESSAHHRLLLVGLVRSLFCCVTVLAALCIPLVPDYAEQQTIAALSLTQRLAVSAGCVQAAPLI